MMLEAGMKLGDYEVLSPLGSGGMGEVYRARDTKLGREVAIKVLPEAFAKDADRLARFEREARLLASLNHPNIATIHGFEHSGDVRFLVMELVPGETLAERIKQGAIPLDDALPLFMQIAEALEAAHEKGVIHRDLKPANIKLTPDGKVKVLDFGLAKAALATPSGDSSESPTITKAGTETGVILGTAGYMSPEQARGKTVDQRTDIWAFGCCFYEALTGQVAFQGDTLSDTLASVLRQDPDWQALPDQTPRSIRRLLERCLQKDPRRRFRDAWDVRVELEEALSEEVTTAAEIPTEPASHWWQVAPWIAAGLLAVAVGLGIWSLVSSNEPPPPVTRLRLSIPPLADDGTNNFYRLTISPDGSRLAFVGEEEDGTNKIFVRAMGELDAKPVEGTESARFYPFFSPDGDWIGFFANDGKLKKVPTSGGRAVTLCDAIEWPGAKWGTDGRIYFGPRNRGTLDERGVSWVPENGGKPQVATKPAEGHEYHSLKDILPSGDAALVAVPRPVSDQIEDRDIGVVSLETGEYRVLIERAAFARYSRSGHLVFARGGTLFAAPFDAGSLQVTGPPTPILEGVAEWAEFVFSDNGTLVWVPATDLDKKLVWVNRRGETRPVIEERRAYAFPRVSPDGRRIAVGLYRDGNRDIWIHDIARGTMTRLTLAPSDEEVPVWTPDGQYVAFATNRDGRPDLAWKPADGSGPTERLTASEEQLVPLSWSPDGRVLAFDGPGGNIWLLPMEGQEPNVFRDTTSRDSAAAFSLDGRWLAYHSNESGRYEIYVSAYPGPGARLQISPRGGLEPLWARDGTEIFYRSVTDPKIMAVPVRLSTEFFAGQPAALFEDRFDRGGGLPRNYDIAPDGEEFLMVESRQSAAPTELVVVLNWFEELKRLVPTN